MRSLIHRTIELLKLRVKDNLDQINDNQAKIKDLLTQPLSPERTYHFEKNYAANKRLLSENNDFINMQLSLINFLEKYKNSPVLDDDLSVIDTESMLMDEDELFELTVQGKMEFDLRHPRFEDDDFFKKLLSYFSAIEAYEKCNDLIKVKRDNSKAGKSSGSLQI